ncbi:MAG: hypothetical protein Q9227_005367 [Pyrenula ochraceoflavens]
MELDLSEKPRPKRPADNELEGEQRLTKRLGRMRLGQPQHRPIATVPPSTIQDANDFMPLDDTKDRIYIHDLESELAEIEEEESNVAFLPEIEKKLAALPAGVLNGNNHVRGREMVLYQDPSSISVPPEHDHVRKAILAARTRAREKQQSDAAASTGQPLISASRNGSNENEFSNHGDMNGTTDDAMDID